MKKKNNEQKSNYRTAIGITAFFLVQYLLKNIHDDKLRAIVVVLIIVISWIFAVRWLIKNKPKCSEPKVYFMTIISSVIFATVVSVDIITIGYPMESNKDIIIFLIQLVLTIASIIWFFICLVKFSGDISENKR